METFNKYQYLRDLQSAISSGVESGELTTEDDIYEFINQDIENECIYYNHCFLICMELNFTDFTPEGNEFGEVVTNISQAAYLALYEYVHDEITIEDYLEAE